MLFNRFRFQSQAQQGFGKRPIADRPASEPALRPADPRLAAPVGGWSARPNGASGAGVPRIYGRPPEARVARVAIARPASAEAVQPATPPEAPPVISEARPVAHPGTDDLPPDHGAPAEPVGHARAPNNVALALQQAFADEMEMAGDLAEVEAEPACWCRRRRSRRKRGSPTSSRTSR
jgi:hypothetical protein